MLVILPVDRVAIIGVHIDGINTDIVDVHEDRYLMYSAEASVHPVMCCLVLEAP